MKMPYLIFAALALTLATLQAVTPTKVISKADVQAWLKLQDIVDGGKGRYTMDEWIIQYGDQASYSATNLKDFKPFSPELASQERVKIEKERTRVFKGIKIR